MYKVVFEPVEAGDVLVLATKAGTEHKQRVRRVLWRMNGLALCATEPDQKTVNKKGVSQ